MSRLLIKAGLIAITIGLLCPGAAHAQSANPAQPTTAKQSTTAKTKSKTTKQSGRMTADQLNQQQLSKLPPMPATQAKVITPAN
ncbi:hypothetical protein [Acidiphilium sp.]|uniref:hypothetical protein n=1 Tax=Acidiphilium sp. TaxID=527 RepID=UPI003CFCB0BF